LFLRAAVIGEKGATLSDSVENKTNVSEKENSKNIESGDLKDGQK